MSPSTSRLGDSPHLAVSCHSHNPYSAASITVVCSRFAPLLVSCRSISSITNTLSAITVPMTSPLVTGCISVLARRIFTLYAGSLIRFAFVGPSSIGSPCRCLFKVCSCVGLRRDICVTGRR